MLKNTIFLLLITILLIKPISADPLPLANSVNECSTIGEKSSLKAGWYINEPYQYLESISRSVNLSGMDVELLNLYSRNLNIKIDYQELDWDHQLSMLKAGNLDLISNIAYSDERAKFLYYSIPYRYEEYAFFTQKLYTNLVFTNIKDFVESIKMQGLKLGIVEGMVYADPGLDAFLNDPINRANITKYSNAMSALNALLREDIDGVIDDKVSSSLAVLKSGKQSQIQEIDLHIGGPIYIAFNKQTLSESTVEKFNEAIREYQGNNEFNKIVRAYTYPAVFTKLVNSKWFSTITLLGIIGFSISSLIVAARYNTNLLGTIICTLLPVIGGGIMRDLMANTEKATILLSPHIICYVLSIIAFGFCILRFLNYNNESNNHYLNTFFNKILLVSDSIGQVAFSVLGVALAAINNIYPLEVWGTFFAFLTANGGGIIRDSLIKDKIGIIHENEVHAEIYIVASFMLSMFLANQTPETMPEVISLAFIVTIIGSIITQIIVSYLKVPNLKFYKFTSKK